MKFSGICLCTNDVPRLVKFYEEFFRTKAEGDEFHAELSAAGLRLVIFSRSGMERMAPGSMRIAGAGGFTLGFEVENVDVEFERIHPLGVEIVKPPQNHPWGTRSFWFRDPDGNIINFWQTQQIQ